MNAAVANKQRAQYASLNAAIGKPQGDSCGGQRQLSSMVQADLESGLANLTAWLK